MFRVKKDGLFDRFSKAAAIATGRPATFNLALLTIAIWAASGPFFGFSDTWQLVINTSTTIITFLMVFLIQNTQNRDGRALQLKLDELIRAINDADNTLLDIEELSENELEKIRLRFSLLANQERGKTTP